MIRIIESKDAKRLFERRSARLTEAEETVRPILEDVRKRGDKALLEYARSFDRLERKSVAVPVAELASAAERLQPEFRSAVEVAAAKLPSLSSATAPTVPWRS